MVPVSLAHHGPEAARMPSSNLHAPTSFHLFLSFCRTVSLIPLVYVASYHEHHEATLILAKHARCYVKQKESPFLRFKSRQQPLQIFLSLATPAVSLVEAFMQTCPVTPTVRSHPTCSTLSRFSSLSYITSLPWPACCSS